MKKVILIILGALLVFIAGVATYAMVAWDKKYDAPFPELKATTDSAMIARGRYLCYGPAHCSSCHVPMDKIDEVKAGAQIPLSGGWTLPIPPGTFRAPNLTPDPETGIGNWTDGQLARALRYLVKHDGGQLFPFMPFQEMSDDDIVAIMSFLRSQPAVKHEVTPSELSFLGKAIYAFGGMEPEGPTDTPPAHIQIDTTIEYGKYIANSVSNCVGCHTNRDLHTGEFIGTPFAGGFLMPPDAFSQGYAFVTPNITPDRNTGIMASWNEDAFISRFRAGRIHAGSPMPWECFAAMDTVELKAVYKYLSNLQPVANKIEKVVFAPGEQLPE